MSDILARQRQLTGTSAQWAANDLVIGDGELAVERTVTGAIKVKVGNGTLTFSALPYMHTEAFGEGYSWRAAASPVSDGARTSPDHPIQVNAVVAYAPSPAGIVYVAVDGDSVAICGNGGTGQQIHSISCIVPPLTPYVFHWEGGITSLGFWELRKD